MHAMISGFRAKKATKSWLEQISYSPAQLIADINDPLAFMKEAIRTWAELSPSESDVNLMMLHIRFETLTPDRITAEDREVVIRFSCLACATSRAARDFVLDWLVSTNDGVHTPYSESPAGPIATLLAACAVHTLSNGQLEDILSLLSAVEQPILDRIHVLCYASKSVHNADLHQVIRIQKEIEMVALTICERNISIRYELAEEIAEAAENIGRRISKIRTRRLVMGDVWREFLSRYQLLSRLPNIVGHVCRVPYTQLSYKDKVK